MQVRCVVSFM